MDEPETWQERASAAPPMISVILSAEIEMTASEVWPDGEAPEAITAQAVADAMEGSGHKIEVLKEWLLLHRLEVSVMVDRPNPAWSGDDVLFADQAPVRFIHEHVDVWA